MSIQSKIKTSVFAKIMFIFLIAHLAIIMTGLGTHKYFKIRQHNESLVKNMIQYSGYITQQIGAAPDTILARQISKNMDIDMRISAGDIHWDSNDGVPSFFADKAAITSGIYDGQFYVEQATESGKYLYLFKTGTEIDANTIQLRLIFMVLVMMVILTLLYFIIRRLLQPVRILDQAVLQLSAGNLDMDLQTPRKDELGQLVNSFNTMVIRLKEMLKARDHLLLDVSHELRSPLTRTKVALEFLEDSTSKQSIHDDILEMETMITEILESERLDSKFGGLNLQPVDLMDLIRQVADDSASLKPGVLLDTNLNKVLLQIDHERMKIAFTNIIQNALKYSDPQGAPVNISVAESETEINISFQDNGLGIPEADIPFIFEPFYRVDKSRSKDTGGYGLGLSLAKKIVEAHHGSIEVKSTFNEGSTFTLKLKKNT